MVERLDESVESADDHSPVAHSRAPSSVRAVSSPASDALPATDSVAASADFRDARPRVDPLAMERARARAEAALFGSAPPAKLGRYVLLGKSGDGGMGVVYAAYDPDLHRKVALKVLHPTRQQHDRAHERLISEARALAKLDHPNVVKVHDVITHDSQVVIVMEWVEGVTLEEWSRTRARSWQEIIDVYVQAAEGLAAAHSVGVIHRDFKPSNAILGIDGRVRVLDFGLASADATHRMARALESGFIDPSSTPLGEGSNESASSGITASGAMIGTLAYAPPEQLLGQATTAACDQFSFGVSLYFALEGQTPFHSTDIAARVEEIAAHQLPFARERRSPTPLRKVIARCLRSDPASRFSSVRELNEALRRATTAGRRHLITAGAVLAATLVGSLALAPGGAQQGSCDQPAPALVAAWNPQVRKEIESVILAATAKGGDAISAHVTANLDAYATSWKSFDREVCLDRHRGEQSEGLLDRRSQCLRGHLEGLRGAVWVLEQTDAASSLRATEVSANLPLLDECSADRLGMDVALPDAAQSDLVATTLLEVTTASELDQVGKSALALERASGALAAAERIGYGPLIARASLVRGRILLSRSFDEEATKEFRHAYDVATHAHLPALAVEAGARRIFTEGMEHPNRDVLEHAVDDLLPIAESLRNYTFAKPLLLNNIGTVYLALGDRTDAQKYFDRAREALVNAREVPTELTVVDRNIALLTPNATTREDLASTVWHRLQLRLGDSSLQTIDALAAYASLIRDPERALPLLELVCYSYRTYHPDLPDSLVYYEMHEAVIFRHLDRLEEAERVYRAVIAAGQSSEDRETKSIVQLARGWQAVHAGDDNVARFAFRDVIDHDRDSPYWWARLRAAQAEVGLARVEIAAGRPNFAVPLLQRAIQEYTQSSALTEDLQPRLGLAEAREVWNEIEKASPPHFLGNERSRADTTRP